MECKELMIGNLIQDIKYKSCWRIISFIGAETVEVDAGKVDFPTDDLHEDMLINLEPIPLTEYWLNKFDFEKVNHSGLKYFNNGNLNISSDLSINYDAGQRVYLKYVHQLQNIYFALTGKELEIINQ